jgi:hypothetical protein
MNLNKSFIGIERMNEHILRLQKQNKPQNDITYILLRKSSSMS